jgi:hypothetical protein
MRIERIERHFGVKLAAGVSCGAGILIGVDSSGTGVLADDSDSVYAHGVALTSGSGTKTAGISQYVNCYRNAQVTDFGNITLTAGGTLYTGESGLIADSAPGTISQKIGFALNSTTAFIDLDSSNLPT